MNRPMKATIRTLLALALAVGTQVATPVLAQDPPRIILDRPNIEPMPIAVPAFIDEGGAGDYAKAISDVVISDLEGTGFFRNIGEEAYISRITSFDGGVAFEDWKAINAQVLITGAVSVSGDRITVKFRAYDVVQRPDAGGCRAAVCGHDRKAGGGWRIRWRMWSIPTSPARAAISTAGWCSSPKAGRRTSG